MNRLIDYFARQGAFVNIITLAVFVVGIFSAVKIRREVFPNVDFDVITILTAYPGASAETIERLITNPLEQDLREVDGIKKMTSVSAENQSVIVMQLDPDQTTSEDAEVDIQDVVDANRDLPEEAEDPIVTVAESKQRPIVTVSLSGADVSEETLRKAAKALERKIETIREVARVNFDGLRDFEIRVEASPEKLRQYRVSLPELINALRRNNMNIPGGKLEATAERDRELIIRTLGEFNSEEDVAKTVIRANALAQAIRIKDVAKVTTTFEKEKIGYRTNGADSIDLTVVKKESADAITLVDKVKALLEKEKPNLFPGIEVDFINDSSYFVRRRLKVLTNNLMVGLGLVLIFLSLILPWRVAGITAFGIPFSFLGAIGIFYLGGISINLISMMGLIIVVGMLVDDAIVVTENAQAFIEEGYDPQTAAIKGTQGIWAPVTVSVLTTIMAFAPMMYMSGIFGKFIQYIPFGVIIALIVSLWECFFVLPHHVAAWVKNPKVTKKSAGPFGIVWEKWCAPAYLKILDYLLAFRYGVAALMIGLIIGTGFLVVKKMDFIMFPPGAIDTFTIRIETPIGTPLEKTKSLIKPIEREVAKLPTHELQDFTTHIGRHGGGGMVNRSKSGSEYAQITVFLTAETERQRVAKEIIADLRKKIGQPQELTRISYIRRQGGPPVGKPISLGVRGESYEKILPAIEAVKDILKDYEGVTDLEDSYIEGKEEIIVKVNDAEAAASGLGISDVGMAVRAAYEGIVPTSIRTLDEEVDVRVMMRSKERGSRQTLEKLQLTNQRGNLIALPQVATLNSAKGVATYEHENNQRQVTVTGEIDTKISSSQAANRQLRKDLALIRPNFPDVQFYFGGEDSDTKESMKSLREAFAFAFFGILMLLVLLFRNLYQPFIVATTIPLGVTAVIWTFYLHQMPLTFLSMVGIIALAGVIVNNAIVLVDFVNKARGRGLDRKASIKDAAQRRLRPIFLTTITTTVGILPTAYGLGGLDPFVVPIALALGWGIAFGSVLTTLVLPAVIAIFDDMRALLAMIMKPFSGGDDEPEPPGPTQEPVYEPSPFMEK